MLFFKGFSQDDTTKYISGLYTVSVRSTQKTPWVLVEH